MYLFKMDKGRIIINPPVLLISEFKEIYSRDKSKDKDKALKELAYIVFTTDYNSIYQTYDPAERESTIREDVFGEAYTPDEAVIKAQAKYQKLQETPTLRFLQAQLKTLEELIMYYKSVDFKERDKRGQPVYKPREITSSMGDSAKLIDSLEKLKLRVQKEQSESGRVKGEAELGLFEDPE